MRILKLDHKHTFVICVNTIHIHFSSKNIHKNCEQNEIPLKSSPFNLKAKQQEN